MASDPRPDGPTIVAMARARRRRRRLFGVVGIALVAVAVGVFAFLRYGRASGPQYRYLTTPAKRGDLREIVTATGTLKGLDSVDVGAQISGRVARVLVEVNAEVKAGQVLAEIDPEQLRSRVEQSSAQVRASAASIRLARATLAQAEAQVARMRDLNQKGLVSSKDLEAAEADAERAKASVASSEAQSTLARASLKDAETSLSWSSIKAPIDGIVLARLVEPGQTVAASLQSPVLFTLARDLTQLQLDVDIDEADVGRVRKGQAASFTVDAWPTSKFASQVVNVHNLPTPEQTVVTYLAELSADNRELKLRPGMTATASIVSSERKDALLVPNAALRFAPPKEQAAPAAQPMLPGFGPPRRMFGRNTGRAPEKASESQGTVYVERGGAPAPIVVEIGGTDGEWSEIVKGDLKPGTPVIVDVEANKAP